MPGMSTRSIPLIATLALAMTLPACGPGKRQVEMQRQQRASTEDQGVFDLGYRNSWRTVPFAPGTSTIEHIEPFDDVVLLVDADSRMTALDAGTGRIRWSVELTDPLTSFVGIGRSGNRALAASNNELFVVDIPTGALADRQSLERIAGGPFEVVGNAAIFGTINGELLSHRVDRGVKSWGNKVGSGMSTSPVAIEGVTQTVIGAVADDGGVLFVDASTGQRVGAISIFGAPGAQPVSGEGLLFATSRDQSFYAFTPDRGDVVWRVRTDKPLLSQPTYDRGAVYVALHERGLVAFDAETGSVRWEAPEIGGTVVASGPRGLVVWDAPNAHLVDAQRGDIIASHELADVDAVFADDFDGGFLFTVTNDGDIAKFSPRF